MYYSNLAAAALVVAAGAAAVVVMFDPVEDIDVGDTEMTFADSYWPVEVAEAGYMTMGLAFAGVWWEHRRVFHRLEGGKTRMLQLISRAMLPSVGQD